MHPEFLHFGSQTIYTYGVMIAIGAALGYFYMSKTAKRELGIAPDKIQMLAIYLIFAAFIGGKLFFYFEKPDYYFNPPSNMFKGFRTGFVFYGSLIFAIPTVIWYFRKNKFPVLPMLDLIAITGCIIHIFGRMGCFFAGCCYGVHSDGPLAITFTHPSSKAPLNEPLHPTQLYSVALIGSILGILLMLKRHKRFEGQLFFLYIMLYSIGRGVIEIFRGDTRRGFIIEDILSHSQFISLILISVVLFFYVKLWKKSKKAA